MIKLKYMLACGVVLLSGSFAAGATQTTTTFANVTGIKDNGAIISLTGVLANTTTPTTFALPPVPDRCATLFLTMLKDPGAFKLTVVTDTEIDALTGVPFTVLASCELDRASHGER